MKRSPARHERHHHRHCNDTTDRHTVPMYVTMCNNPLPASSKPRTGILRYRPDLHSGFRSAVVYARVLSWHPELIMGHGSTNLGKSRVSTHLTPWPILHCTHPVFHVIFWFTIPVKCNSVARDEQTSSETHRIPWEGPNSVEGKKD